MNKNRLPNISLLRIMLDEKEITASDVFITGDAVALWQVQNEHLIDLDLWCWHLDASGGNRNYIVTDIKKAAV